MSQFKDRFYKPALVIMIVISLLISGATQKSLNAKRERMGLTRTTEPLKNAPPLLAFTTVALGGFRGLIANSLWMRLYDLQMEGKYFEFVQLSHWITQLQPTIPDVWIHLAWNLSYNVSVKFEEPDKKWPWVRRGIELLRDGGLEYNPNSVDIYRELAWQFQHKMGMDLDSGHMYYKELWSNQFSEVLVDGSPEFDSLINPQTPEDRDRLRLLRETYKMDPTIMQAVDNAYGPLEWRLPETHAIYWAYAGMQIVKNQYQNDLTGFEHVKNEEYIKLRRVIYQSMQLAFRRGRLIPVRDAGMFDFGPNIDLVANADKSFRDMMDAETPEWRDHIQTGHRNMLIEATYVNFTKNRKVEAQKWFDMLRSDYPQAVEPGKSMEQFCVERISEIINETSRDRVRQLLDFIIETAYYNIAIGEDAEGMNNLELARKAYNKFLKETAVPTGDSQEGRVILPEFESIRTARLKMLLDPDTSPWSPELRTYLRSELGLVGPSPEPDSDSSAPSTGQQSPVGDSDENNNSPNADSPSSGVPDA